MAYEFVGAAYFMMQKLPTKTVLLPSVCLDIRLQNKKGKK